MREACFAWVARSWILFVFSVIVSVPFVVIVEMLKRMEDEERCRGENGKSKLFEMSLNRVGYVSNVPQMEAQKYAFVEGNCN
jgi:hypothetical protein